MKKNMLNFMLCALLATPVVCAQAPADSNAEVQEEPFEPVSEAELSASADEFSRPNEELGQIEEITRPNCDSPLFKDKVLHVITDILNEQQDYSTMALRQKKLLLAHLSEFEEAPAVGFSAKEDENVADILIMLKINQKISEKDILICRQSFATEKPIYIILYPYIDNYKGLLVNLNRYKPNSGELSFIYP